MLWRNSFWSKHAVEPGGNVGFREEAGRSRGDLCFGSPPYVPVDDRRRDTSGLKLVDPDLIRAVTRVALLPAVGGIALAPKAERDRSRRPVPGLWLGGLARSPRIAPTVDVHHRPGRRGGLVDYPLLLVELAMMILMVSVVAQRGAFRERTRLAKAVLVLAEPAVLEAVNPLQGSPLVGLSRLRFLPCLCSDSG